LIDNLVGLYRENGIGLQAYIHADLMDRFVGWLNVNNPEMGGDSNGMSWKAVPLDSAARLDFKESDDLYPLLIERNKIGYAKGLEQQTIFQDLLTQVFPSGSLRGWRV
jgi:hypothetical protein